MAKLRLTLLTVATALVACGGGIGELVAVLGTIGGAGGDFLLDGDPATTKVETVLNANGDPRAINISPVGGSSDDNFFASSYAVEVIGTGSLGGATQCAGVQGTITGDRLDLGANCFRGRYTSANRVVSDDGKVVLWFTQFSPSLSTGIWVDISAPTRRVKFTNNNVGCEIVNGVPSGSKVSLTQVFNDPASGRFSSVSQFRIGTQLWTSGEYVGVSGLRLSGGQSTLELERRRDATPATGCPP